MGNLVFQATLGGQVNLVGPNTASTYNINVPTVSGDMVTTGDTGTVTNTMLAGSIANAKLVNSSFTIGSTAVSLGETKTTVAGLTLTTATLTNPTINGFTGDTSVVNIGSGQFYKDTSGNVGIGTSSPAHKLDINGNTNLVSTAYLSWNGSSSYSIQGVGGGSGYIRAFTGGNEALRLTAAGLLQFNSGYGSVATAYGCRAWVRFAANGSTGADGSIFGSGGITSVTKTATATFTANFSFTFPDGNYSVAGTVQKSNTNANACVGIRSDSVFGTTSLSGIVAAVPGTGTDNSAVSMSLQFFR